MKWMPPLGRNTDDVQWWSVTTNSSSTHLLFWCLHPFLWLLSAVLPMYIFFIFLPLPCLTAVALATVATWWGERCFEPRLNSSHEATLKALRRAWGRWWELSICDKPGEKEQGKQHSFEVLTFRNDTFCSVAFNLSHSRVNLVKIKQQWIDCFNVFIVPWMSWLINVYR